MARVVVYGASDDLVEVDGDLSEEFTSFEPKPDLLEFSDGTWAEVKLDTEGQWRIKLVEDSGLIEAVHTPSREEDGVGPRYDEDGCNDYSDKLVLTGPIEWVKHHRGK